MQGNTAQQGGISLSTGSFLFFWYHINMDKKIKLLLKHGMSYREIGSILGVCQLAVREGRLRKCKRCGYYKRLDTRFNRNGLGYRKMCKECVYRDNPSLIASSYDM